MRSTWSGFGVTDQPVAASGDVMGASEGVRAEMSRVEGDVVQTPVVFTLALPREPAASSLARRAVRDRLAGAVASRTLDDVVLVVSELVANALVHGCGDIELRIWTDAGEVRGQVSDQGGSFEPPTSASASGSLGGLGLFIVAQLAASWGVREGTARVWFQIPAGAVAGSV